MSLPKITAIILLWRLLATCVDPTVITIATDGVAVAVDVAVESALGGVDIAVDSPLAHGVTSAVDSPFAHGATSDLQSNDPSNFSPLDWV
jgi:hypothetical protein